MKLEITNYSFELQLKNIVSHTPPPTSCALIQSPELHFMKRKKYETPCYKVVPFLSARSECSSQHYILKYPHFMFFYETVGKIIV